MKLEQMLQITPVERHEFLLFGLKVFDFFKSPKNKNILLLGIPRMANCLIIFPYIFKIGLLNFRRKRYFVRLNNYVLATFSLAENPDSIHIYSLTVDPKWRQHGIATYILDYVEARTTFANKKGLEVGVHKTNKPALRLYKRFGFVKIGETKWFICLRKNVRK